MTAVTIAEDLIAHLPSGDFCRRKFIFNTTKKSSCRRGEIRIYAEPSGAELSKAFDEIERRSQTDEELATRLKRMQRRSRSVELCFVGFEFDQLPTNLGKLFPGIYRLTFDVCRMLNSLGSIFQQFEQLEVLVCSRCSSLISLSSLDTISHQSRLSQLHFNKCGLRVSASDDWGLAMRSIGMAHGRGNGGFELKIQNCDHLCSLPASIRELGSIQGSVKIHLQGNKKLKEIPPSIGMIHNLSHLGIRKCTSLTTLPREMGRTPPTCEIEMDTSGNQHLIGILQQSGVDQKILRSDHYTGNFEVRANNLQPYFKILNEKIIVGAVKLQILLRSAKLRSLPRLPVKDETSRKRPRNDLYRPMIESGIGTVRARKKQVLDPNWLANRLGLPKKV
mmetsp:Transcript_20684/g.30327  ORF Transcript_20684/g.30327 Transcript_20684/m.30327 type:complete len:391 (-) Transcript_20684:36-1208(-)